MSFWSPVIPMNIGGQVRREKVAIVAGDAPFLVSKPFLQHMGFSWIWREDKSRWTWESQRLIAL